MAYRYQQPLSRGITCQAVTCRAPGQWFQINPDWSPKKTHSYNKYPESLCYEQKHMSVLILIETIIKYRFNYSSSYIFSSAAQTLTSGWPFCFSRRFDNAGNLLRWWFLSVIVGVLRNSVQSWTAARSKIQQKIQSQCLLPQIEICFLICIHREISKLKQSVLTLVSLVSSTGIRNNNIIRITPTMILYETDWTRSASSDMRTFSPDVGVQTLI